MLLDMLEICLIPVKNDHSLSVLQMSIQKVAQAGPKALSAARGVIPYMPFRLRLTVIFFVVVLLSAAILPLIYPIPELETVPPQKLAQPGDKFAEVDGVNLRYTETGTAPPTLLLLHDFGSSVFSWRKVTGALGEQARVIAFDRPGFGLSERPAVAPGETGVQNPYTPEAQVALSVGLLDKLGVKKAVLIGNSAGGAVAVNFALTYPERVAGLVLVDPALQSGGPPALIRSLYNTPQGRRIGPYLMRPFGGDAGLEQLRRAYADPSRLSDADIAGYRRPLKADGWDRALWEITKANKPGDLFSRLGELKVPTLVVSGAKDNLIPVEQSQKAAADIDGAAINVLPDCGHLPQEECPQKFLAVVTPWLNTLQTDTAVN